MSRLSSDCSACGYHRDLSADILRSYRIDESTNVTIPVAYGWCRRCAQVTAVEALPSLEAIDAEIALVPAEHAAQNAESRQALRRWRIGRVGPAKCLECGATDFERFEEIPLPDYSDDSVEHEESDESFHPLVHAGCGGQLTLYWSGFSRACIWIFYTPEGDRIAAYDVYASRGLVPRPDPD